MAEHFAALTRLLADTSVRALLLAVLAAIVLRVWPAHNANFQHRAWSAVLWCMLLLPVLTQLTPGLSLLPAGWRWESRPLARQTSAGPRRTIEVQANVSQPLADDLSESETKAGEIVARGIPSVRIAADSDQRRAAAMPKTSALGWSGLILAVYLLGAALLATRLALGYWAVCRLVRRATDIPRKRDCRARVAASDAVRVPVSVGILRPVILLPADWSGWSDALLSSVVMHEQAHIDRRDHLVLLASELNRCLYWFHPVAWFLRRRLSALAEQCCDDTVIAALASRGDYARHLLEVASRLTIDRQRVVPLGISMARTSQVESRIVAILDERRPLAGRLGRGGVLALAAIVGPIVLLAAGLRAADPPPQKQPAAIVNESVAPVAEPKAKAEPQTQAEAEKPTVKGVPVSGRVVLASDGSPAASAEVRLLLNKADWYRVGVRRTNADEQGNFAFEDVPAGPHFVVAVLDRLASYRKRPMTVVNVAADHPPEPVLLKLWPAPTIAVNVTAKADGAPVAGAQLWLADTWWDEQADAQGNVVLQGLTPELWRVRIHAEGFAAQTIPVKLEGTQRAELSFALEPGGKIHGAVKDESGKPLPNFDVDLSFSGPHDNPWLEGTKTDAEGRYHFESVPLNQNLEVDSGRDQYLRTRQTTHLTGGGNSNVEVNPVLERRPVGGSIQGVVTDQDGKPIVGASLTNRGNSSRDVHETFSVGAGRFTLDDLYSDPRGTFLVFRAKGFAPQAVSVTPGPADEPTEIAVKLEPGHRIRGRVLDVAGQPIAGASVDFAEGRRLNPANVGGGTKTDAEGRFEFDSLPADCPFDFELNGYSPLQGQMLALDGEQEVIVTLQPQGIVRGRVVNAATGAPVKSFRVRIAHSPDREPDDPKGGINGSRAAPGEQFEAPDGRFVLDGLMVGLPLQVSVDTDDFGVTTLRRVLPRPATDAEIVEFKLGPSDPALIATLSGVIVDDRGRPKHGAQLRLIVAESDPEQQRRFRFQWGQVREGRIARRDGVVQVLSATTDRQGAFHFDHVRTDHEMELFCWGEGISDDRVVHLEQLTDGQRQHLRLENPMPGAIEGKINREAFPDVRDVSAVHQGVGGIYDVDFRDQPKKTDYQLRNLPPGRYWLNVRTPPAPGGGFQPPGDGIIVFVKPGETTKLDIGF